MRVSLFWIALIVGSSVFHGTKAARCISSIEGIYDIEESVINTRVQRIYTLCPNRRYKVGTYDFYNKNLLRGSKSEPPLPLRPNIKIQCGEDGSRSCVISSGDLQIDGTAIHGLRDAEINNVEIVGFVFEDAIEHSFLATKPGSIIFKNCEWKNINRSNGPIILDYYDDFARSETLSVSFEDCRFHDNRYFGYGAQTALVTGNGQQNKLEFSRTVFDNNNMRNGVTSSESRTHLVESLGQVTIKNSCFVNNKVTAATVAVYNDKFTSSAVVHVNEKGGSLCQYASVFENYSQYRSLQPSCIPIDSSKTVCDLDSAVIDPIEPVNQYVPFTINALEFDSAFENEDKVLQGGCNREGYRPTNGPDAQNTRDPVCLNFGGCHISHTTTDEYLIYRFAHSKSPDKNGDVLVDISVRVSSGSKKKFKLELMYDGQVGTSKVFSTEGLGFQKFSSITWRNVPLRADKPIHSIRVYFLQGNTNLCAIGVEFSGQKEQFPPTAAPTPKPNMEPEPTRVPTSVGIVLPSFAWTALDYDTAYENSPGTSRGGCNTRTGGVDAQPTNDNVCVNRDNSRCNIGWWDAGEYLTYKFSVPPDGRGKYNIRIRAATARPNKFVETQLITGNRNTVWDSASLLVPKQGNQDFRDVVWSAVFLEANDYSLKITSAGNTNLCSVAIFPTDTSGDTDPDQDDDGPHNVSVPGSYSAMYYSDIDSFDKTAVHNGDCPFRKDSSIDAKINNDAICQQSKTIFDNHCNIAFVNDNEHLFYDVTKEDDQERISVAIRVASKRQRRVRVELYSSAMVLLQSKELLTPKQDSWDTYETLAVWDRVYIGNQQLFKMKITFLEGNINFCSFEIE
mmetsp:Transcript_111283/g.227857  ORF Transcript_111283/g.227857 Transcript_111283/m.227857 type:complete len:847 (-) Transcript_111283:243-2783(-)